MHRLFQSCRGCFDVCEDGVNNSTSRDLDQDDTRNENDISGPTSLLPQNAIVEHKKLSGSLVPDNSFFAKKFITDGDRLVLLLVL